MSTAFCPHCKEGKYFEIRPINNHVGTGHLGQALCCTFCNKIVHVYEPKMDYNPILGAILTELQAQSDKKNT